MGTKLSGSKPQTTFVCVCVDMEKQSLQFLYKYKTNYKNCTYYVRNIDGHVDTFPQCQNLLNNYKFTYYVVVFSCSLLSNSDFPR